MHNLDEQRYQFRTEIKTVHHGHLFYGKDLSLNRNVLLYQIETNLSNDKSLDLIRSVNGYNHPNFFHILDIGHCQEKILVVLELRKGKILSGEIESVDLPFQQCIEMTMKIGKMADMALEGGIRSFSISTDNIWLTEDQTFMVINYWNEADSKFRGAQGLFHFLYQLLSKSSEIPESAEKIKENLQIIKQARSLSDQQAQILDQLYHEAYSSSSSSLSFILLLAQLVHQPVKQTEEPVQAMKTESVPQKERWIDIVRSHVEQFKQNGIPQDWIPMDAIRKVWTQKKKPLLAVVILFVIIFPVIIFMSNGEKSTAIDPERLPSMASKPVETKPESIDQDKEEQTPQENQVEEEPLKEDRTEENNHSLTFNDAGQAMESDSGQTNTTEVPQLVGLSQQEAEQQALASGLRYQYFLEVNEQPAGTVFRQDMEAGASTNKDAQVTFWVSKGPGM